MHLIQRLLSAAVLCSGFISLSGCVSVQDGGEATIAEKPNILWIVAEDMSLDLGCYGNDLVTTPNIDGLAAKGMRFDRVFTTAPACSPSRTALATGVYQTTLGAYHMRYSEELLPTLPKGIRILPELLREQGYTTANVKDVCETGVGKDDWLFTTDQKIWDTESWDELVAQQPFYGQIHFTESHRAFANKAEAKINPDDVVLPPYYPNHPVARADWAGYLNDVNRADELVGLILEQLEASGVADNTIIVFISDHGRPMIRDKNWLYDSGTQVPLVIYIPDGVAKPDAFKVGGVDRDMISAIDLTAETLLMAGGEIPDWMQGRSFLRKDSKPRGAIYTAIDRVGNIDSRARAVRTDRYKYIRNYKTPGSINECTTAYRRGMHPIYHLLNVMHERGQLTPEQAQLMQPMAEAELYDLKKDPFEMYNLAGDSNYASIQKKLQQQLDGWIMESGDRGFEPDSQAIIDWFNFYGEKTAKQYKHLGVEQRTKVQAYFK